VYTAVTVCASAAEPNTAKASAAIQAIRLSIVYTLPLVYPAFFNLNEDS
jgi:hypothetical protein